MFQSQTEDLTSSQISLQRQCSQEIIDNSILELLKAKFEEVSGETMLVDKAQLKQVFELMDIPVPSDEEFDYQFEQMDEQKLGKIAWENFSNFLVGPDESNRRAKESSQILSEDGSNQLSLEFIPVIVQLFEENKFHSSDWPAENSESLNQVTSKLQDGDEYLLDLFKLRQKLQTNKEKDQDNKVSLEAFDSFFGKLADNTDAVLITQSEFSAMIREKELMLLQKSFPVQDLSNNMPIAVQQQPIPGQESVVLEKSRSTIIQEKEGRLNLAYRLKEDLADDHPQPQIQLQQLFQILTDQESYGDFRDRDWNTFFQLLGNKVDKINQIICKAENERDIFMKESKIAEATNLEWKRDKDEISRLKYFLERDQMAMQEIQKKYDELLESQTGLDTANSNLDQKELIESLRSQIALSAQRLKDLTEDKKRLNDKILDMNIDMAKIKKQKYEENEAAKLQKMNQLAQLDLQIRDKMRFKHRSSDSKLLMRLSSTDKEGGSGQDQQQQITTGLLSKSKSTSEGDLPSVAENNNRFQLIDDIIEDHKEENEGASFDDVYQNLNFAKAVSLKETNESNYLMVMQTIGQDLDPADPQSTQKEKAVHSIAAGYVKNRLTSDILIKQFKGYQAEKTELEELISELNKENSGLHQVRVEEQKMRDDMLARIEELEEINAQQEQSINELENDLLNEHQNIFDVNARDQVQRKFTMLKESRRMTQKNQSEDFRERIRKIADNSTLQDLQEVSGNQFFGNIAKQESSFFRNTSFSSTVGKQFNANLQTIAEEVQQEEQKASSMPGADIQIAQVEQKMSMVSDQSKLRNTSSIMQLQQNAQMAESRVTEDLSSPAVDKVVAPIAGAALGASAPNESSAATNAESAPSESQTKNDDLTAPSGSASTQQADENSAADQPLRNWKVPTWYMNQTNSTTQSIMQRQSSSEESKGEPNLRNSDTVTRFTDIFAQNQGRRRANNVVRKAPSNDTDFPARTIETVNFLPGMQIQQAEKQRNLQRLRDQILRSSNIIDRKNSLLQRNSNRTDFDYLELRNQENIRMYRPIQAILDAHAESQQIAIFSEIVQHFDTSLTSTEMIIMITHKSLYLIDSRCNLKRRYDLSSLSEVILIIAHPSFFALSFTGGQPPLILESFRRSELSFYALQTREYSNPKPRIVMSDTIQLLKKNGEAFNLDFDKAFPQPPSTQWQKKSKHAASLFKGAILSGYLDRFIKGFFGKNNWPRVYVVLCSFGLLYFKDDSGDFLESDVQLVPFAIEGIKLVEIDPESVGGAMTVFGLMHNDDKHCVAFRCESLTEFKRWTQTIQKQLIEHQQQASKNHNQQK